MICKGSLQVSCWLWDYMATCKKEREMKILFRSGKILWFFISVIAVFSLNCGIPNRDSSKISLDKLTHTIKYGDETQKLSNIINLNQIPQNSFPEVLGLVEKLSKEADQYVRAACVIGLRPNVTSQLSDTKNMLRERYAQSALYYNRFLSDTSPLVRDITISEISSYGEVAIDELETMVGLLTNPDFKGPWLTNREDIPQVLYDSILWPDLDFEQTILGTISNICGYPTTKIPSEYSDVFIEMVKTSEVKTKKYALQALMESEVSGNVINTATELLDDKDPSIVVDALHLLSNAGPEHAKSALNKVADILVKYSEGPANNVMIPAFSALDIIGYDDPIVLRTLERIDADEKVIDPTLKRYVKNLIEQFKTVRIHANDSE